MINILTLKNIYDVYGYTRLHFVMNPRLIKWVYQANLINQWKQNYSVNKTIVQNYINYNILVSCVFVRNYEQIRIKNIKTHQRLS